MAFRLIIQVLLCLNVAGIVTAALDDRTLAILEDIADIPNEHDNTFNSKNNYAVSVIDRQEPLLDRLSQFDEPLEKIRNFPSYHRNVLENKPKRAWEDLNMIWRRSPKRAWEMVNKLWRIPDIRRRYKNYLQNGKRSDEVMENIPVQQDKLNQMWMADDIGYDIDSDQPEVPTIPGNTKTSLSESKRGWEEIGPFGQRSVWKRLLKQRRNKNNVGKRGWEDIVWKRNGRSETDGMDAMHNMGFGNDETIDLAYNKLPESYVYIPGQQELTRAQEDLIRLLIADNSESDLHEFIKSYENSLLPEKNKKPKPDHEYETDIETEWTDNESPDRASYTRLCRLLFGNAVKCRPNTETAMLYDNLQMV